MQSIDGLSNEQLLSALTGKPAAAELIRRFGGLTNLAQASFDELRKVPGVGPSRASSIRSAFLLAQRLSRESYPESPLLDTPERVAGLMREEYRPCVVEKMHVICVNTRRRLITAELVAQGILDSVTVHAREIFSVAIARRASAVILVHNHPSGDPNPSDADIRMTREMIKIGQLLKIEVLDHVIVGHRTPERTRDYVSLRELGLLQ